MGSEDENGDKIGIYITCDQAFFFRVPPKKERLVAGYYLYKLSSFADLEALRIFNPVCN